MNENAFEYADKALNLDKKRPEAYKLRVRLFNSLEEYSLAEIELDKLKEQGKENLPYYYSRKGRVKLEQGMFNESKAYFRNGIEEEGVGKYPFLSYDYVFLGLIYLMDNDLDMAFDCFNQSIYYINYISSSEGKEWVLRIVHIGMGIAYQKKGLNQEAKKEFEFKKSIFSFPMRDFFEKNFDFSMPG